MGTIKNGKEWSGVAINNFDTDGAVKNGNVFWEAARYFMGILNSIPDTGEQLKTLLGDYPIFKEYNKYIIKSNGIATNIIIAIPADKTLVKVVSSLAETLYSEATPSEDNNFILSNSLTTIPKDGVNQDYKVYIMSTAIPFSSGVTFNITII